MADDRIHASQQQNLLALLAHSEHGKLVAEFADPALFEGDYRLIAERLINYWRQYGVPPNIHTPDLFSDIIENRTDRRSPTFRRIILDMARLADDVNVEYVIRQLKAHTRIQGLKAAVHRSWELLSRPGETTAEQVEEVLGDVQRARTSMFEPGAKLDQIDRVMDYLSTHGREFTTGIREFDTRGIVPSRGTVFLMLAGKGRGKSWFLINCGKRALLARKKVLHISLENSEDETLLRYWQALYAIPKRLIETARVTMLERGRNERVTSWRFEDVPIDFSFESTELRQEMETRIEMLGGITDNLVIKRWPNRQLTPQMMRGYLDSLEIVDGFVPDLIALDYVSLMKLDIKHKTDSVIENMEESRAIAIDRNAALVTAEQLTREGYDAIQAKSTSVANAWGEIHTADISVVHSATDAEMNHGLARLYVAHARAEADKFGVLITQAYPIGQFVIDSAYLPPRYFDDILQDLRRRDEPDDEQPDDDGEIKGE